MLVYGFSVFALFSVLLVLSLLDFKYRYLPDYLTLSLLWLGLLLNLNTLYTPLQQAVLGAAVGFISLYSLNALFFVLYKKHGLGGGDMKLFAALGAWFGLQSLPVLLLLASISALLFSVCYYALTRVILRAVAFGPFLALSSLAYILYNAFL